jgi:ketosteroid isomerase-like protein
MRTRKDPVTPSSRLLFLLRREARSGPARPAGLLLALALLALGLGAPLPLTAQVGGTPDAAMDSEPGAAAAAAEEAAEEADHEALRGLKALFEEAINENHIDRLGPYLDEGFSGVMVTDRLVTGLDEMEAYWSDMRELIGEGGSYRMEIEPERSLLFGDWALAKGTTQDTVVTGDGDEFHFSSHWTAVCRKSGGAWKILCVHGSMDPIGNEFVQTFRDRAVKLMGFGGLAAGLVVGLLVGVFLGRRRAS